MEIHTNFVLEAISTVLGWDIPDEGYANAINTQACHLAGLEAEDVWAYDVGISVH